MALVGERDQHQVVVDVEALAGFVDDELSVLPDELGVLDDDPLSFDPADDDPTGPIGRSELFAESLDRILGRRILGRARLGLRRLLAAIVGLEEAGCP